MNLAINDLPSFAFPSRKFSLQTVLEIRSIRDLTSSDFKLNEFIQLDEKSNELEEDEDVNTQINNDAQKKFKKDNQNKKTNFKSKGLRMLCLTLFSGEREIKAVEYQPITKLTLENCKPGVKVLIKGLVEMTLTVLLLKPENIEIVSQN